MWVKLISLQERFSHREWCIGGYFNYIINRKGSKFISDQMRKGEIQEFNGIIDLMEMVDVPIIGNKFTWTNLEGSLISNLD